MANRPVLGHVDELREIALRHGVSEIFVAMPSLGHTRLLSLVLECEDLGITFRVVTNLFEVLTAGSPLDLVDDLPLVQLGRDRPNPLYAPIKRALDLIGATLGLLVAGPVLLACVWRIRRERRALGLLRADAHRPARQALHLLQAADAARGRGSLHRGAADGRRSAHHPGSGASCAARASTSCRSSGTCCAARCRWWARAPRCPSSSTRYDEWQRRRLTVKPGLTGLWQILGRKDLPMHANLQYDFYYIRNRGVALDLSILLRTIGAVLSRRGAF